MRRLQLLEIHEQAWCPAVIRDALTDFLQASVRTFGVFDPAAPVLDALLARTGERTLVDLCAGGGGPWLRLGPRLTTSGVAVRLTDRNPSRVAPERLSGAVTYEPTPVDATDVPAELAGVRTMFNALHHFPPDQVRAMLADAVRRPASGVAFFECTARTLPALLLTTGLPALVWLLTPFVRPWSWRRLWWTYVVPVVPFVVWFDGVVSCLRSYTAWELKVIAAEAGGEAWTWETRSVWPLGAVLPVTWIVGRPRDPA